MNTIIFDLDGTLYEDERVYELYAREVAARLPASHRAGYIRDWEAARAGRSLARIGMGYDAGRDLLFRHSRGIITEYVDWTGRSEPVPPPPQPHPDDPQPPTDIPLFGPDRFNVGDWWGLAGILAAHHGFRGDGIREAFMATREVMDAPSFDLHVDRELMETIRRLHEYGLTLIAMSNSPQESVDRVFERLDVRECFADVRGMCRKPAGMIDFLDTRRAAAGDILSIGDNFVNDIEPVLDFGGRGLYIDRHRSALSQDRPGCDAVPSILEAARWLQREVLHAPVE